MNQLDILAQHRDALLLAEAPSSRTRSGTGARASRSATVSKVHLSYPERIVRPDQTLGEQLQKGGAA